MNRDEVLKKLRPFENREITLYENQTTNDIIGAIQKKHADCKKDYDQIWMDFEGDDPVDTAKNVFKFLKKNVEYIIEPDDLQVVKTPAAIISTGRSMGSDCKNYSLFVNGILDAMRRNGSQYNYDLYYRYASYDDNKTPQHVFAVMNVDGREYWVDPVLTYFDEKKDPNFFKDKIVPMSLKSLSGIDPYGNYGSPAYSFGFKKYGNYAGPNTPRPQPPSSKGNFGIGAADYTPYFMLAAAAVAFYFIAKK